MDFGSVACHSALGTAAVVDGSQILLTPLRHTIIPPPMAAAVVQTSKTGLGLDAAGLACLALREAHGSIPEVSHVLEGFSGCGCLLLFQHDCARGAVHSGGEGCQTKECAGEFCRLVLAASSAHLCHLCCVLVGKLRALLAAGTLHTSTRRAASADDGLAQARLHARSCLQLGACGRHKVT